MIEDDGMGSVMMQPNAANEELLIKFSAVMPFNSRACEGVLLLLLSLLLFDFA